MGALDMGVKQEELQALVDKWRSANPRIYEFWYDIQRAVIKCLKSGQPSRVRSIGISKVADYGAQLCYLNVELPSGRKLYYATPHLTQNKWGGDSIGYYGMNQETKKWAKMETYGGKLVENITQAVARDCLTVALDRLYSRGYKILFHVHDEVVIESPIGRDDLHTVCTIMGEPIPWAEGLLLTAEGFEGLYYKKDG
jgi:DNA polymerase